MKNKWILFTVALVLIAINLLNGDFSAFKQLSAVDLLPVIVIALVSFLIKTGVLSAAVGMVSEEISDGGLDKATGEGTGAFAQQAIEIYCAH